MKITLFDTNPEICKELKKEFKSYKEITVVNKSLEELEPHDCLVTAGNSYGIMNGGIDLYARKMFGIEFQDTLQWAIVEHYGGKLPIGCSMTINIQNDKFKSIMYAPTMTIPKQIVSNDILVVFYNILYTFKQMNLENLACCGLGTGTGGIDAITHAKMLKKAYLLFKNEEKK